ncbi:hypothetical protein [Horticoccus sp. 23ND18S-11]|uniref:hypothetical protein n=1 Tax=Horticoccus sp. 23ND18S-11 TaxID=3391832 RepID=UPI0039C9F9AA
MPSAHSRHRFLQSFALLATVACASAQPSSTLTDLGVRPGFTSAVASAVNDL